MCALLVLIATANSCYSQPESLSQLIVGAAQTPEGAVVIFSPTSCSTASSMVSLLDSIATVPGVTVQGIIINPPASKSDRGELLRRFGMRFPVRPDIGGRWYSAVHISGYPLPVVAVVSRGQVEAIVAGNLVGDFAKAIRTHFGVQQGAAN